MDRVLKIIAMFLGATVIVLALAVTSKYYLPLFGINPAEYAPAVVLTIETAFFGGLLCAFAGIVVALIQLSIGIFKTVTDWESNDEK